MKEYESDTFKEDVEQLWQTMKPLYEQLHAYVRAKLRDVYGDQFDNSDGLIPAHLLGKNYKHHIKLDRKCYKYLNRKYVGPIVDQYLLIGRALSE